MAHYLPKIVSVVLLAALAPLTMALGNPDYDPATGTLKLSFVDFNGVKRYQNVELKLNMASGTFQITKATPVDTRIPDLPVQEITKNGLKVGLRGCLAQGQSVTCHIILTSIDFNTAVTLGGSSASGSTIVGLYETSVYDDKGNNYRPSAITISNTNGTNSIRDKVLIANVPTPATITMENVSLSATSFSSIFLKINNDITNRIFGDFEFKNIAF